MAQEAAFENQVRDRRSSRGWSQDELARRSGLSRAGISAIETGRLVPSAAAALAIAAALECRVEDVFQLSSRLGSGLVWAWPAEGRKGRYWAAEVGGLVRLYPVEATALGLIPHDGVQLEAAPGDNATGDATKSSPPDLRAESFSDPASTLVLASCDPAVGLLAAVLARTFGVRLLPLPRPSHSALELLGQGLVHAAGVHLSRADDADGNARIVRDKLGAGYRLLRAARWEEGIALSPRRKVTSLRAAVGSNLCWVGRQDGSGARQCLDELLGDKRRSPRCQASDHRGVAEAVRGGCADAGVCLRLVSEEAGLDFFSVREEAYDLCFPARIEGDRRIQALLQTLRSNTYRRLLSELPGYGTAETGELLTVP